MTTELTQRQYVRRKGQCCPGCGKKDTIIGEEVTIDAGYATQECHCVECDAEWKDQYRLTGFQLTRTPTTGD